MKSSELIKLIQDYEEMFGEFNIDNSFDIDKLKAEVEHNKQKKLIPFEMGDEYCFINIQGKVCNAVYNGDSVDINAFMLGNVFKTKEEAEFEIERRKLEHELLMLGGSRDMNKFENDIAYEITLDGDKVCSMWTDNNLKTLNTIYFEDEDTLNSAVKIVGEDRIKKYMYYVED